MLTTKMNTTRAMTRPGMRQPKSIYIDKIKYNI